MKISKTAMLCAALALAMCGASASHAQASSAMSPSSGHATSQSGGKMSNSHALMNPSSLNAQAPATFDAKFVTTKGDFTVHVTRAWAPLGADRFYNLVKNGFYDNCTLFRVVPGFVVQFGINGDPKVAQVWDNASIKDDPVKSSNKKGTITFAMAGPNTRTTQVFINLKDNAFLDSQGFTPFGAVDANGLNVVGMFYDQYGDSAGMDQEPMEKGGEKYISTKWPKLDTIKKASVVGQPASAPKPAATTAKPKSTTTAKPQQ
jgi:peptidyl-prolyl cis-trans isomerase A (cyclophilin A)